MTHAQQPIGNDFMNVLSSIANSVVNGIRTLASGLAGILSAGTPDLEPNSMPSPAESPSETQKPKIGATHLGAMGRLGLTELSQILPATNDSVQPQPEIGLYGTALPQDVYQARHGEQPNLNQNLEMTR